MKRITCLFLLVTTLVAFNSRKGEAQIYILNEDFNTASGTTPPLEWTSRVQSGVAEDVWYFDNPGGQSIGFPIISPFPIFDAANYSNNAQAELIALESPSFDASISNYIMLEFDHIYSPGTNSLCKIQAYNGTEWFDIITYNSGVPQVTHETVDISARTGGVTNARLRFIWSGNGSGFWAFDNVRIYGALPYDAGIVSLDNPKTPFGQGSHPVKVTLKNFGYNNLTSASIHWSIDNIQQPVHNWTGSKAFGESQADIQIGTYNFQRPVLLKVWPENPNGQPDPNPYNDTISVNLSPSLCGSYTIGGVNPDFATFTEAVTVLNKAGISCPVVFKVRDGTYNEQVIINDIVGSSPENTITFESESGDSTKVMIRYDVGSSIVVNLKQAKYICFRRIGFQGYRTLAINDYSHHVTIERCYFQAYDEGILVSQGSREINISNNTIKGASYGLYIVGQSYSTNPNNIEVTNNVFTGYATKTWRVS